MRKVNIKEITNPRSECCEVQTGNPSPIHQDHQLLQQKLWVPPPTPTDSPLQNTPSTTKPACPRAANSFFPKKKKKKEQMLLLQETAFIAEFIDQGPSHH